MNKYLLDTNHCSRIIQGHLSVIGKLEELGNTPVATCAVVYGELIFMAHKSQKRAENLSLIRRFLRDIPVYPINNETADIYGKLKASLLDHFGPKKRQNEEKRRRQNSDFGENDLWIAAIAKQFDLIVVSSDGDFGRIQEVEPLRLESWL